jgi:hypothetical protein
LPGTSGSSTGTVRRQCRRCPRSQPLTALARVSIEDVRVKDAIREELIATTTPINFDELEKPRTYLINPEVGW